MTHILNNTSSTEYYAIATPTICAKTKSVVFKEHPTEKRVRID
jgi:hypothetical protein